MRQANPRQPSIALELALLLALATLWGGSYTFIKLGVATIPPITLIAARTAIAGLLLLAIMHARGMCTRTRPMAAVFRSRETTAGPSPLSMRIS